MENKEYLSKIKEVDDLKLFSMSEWIEAEKKIYNKMNTLVVIIVCMDLIIAVLLAIIATKH